MHLSVPAEVSRIGDVIHVVKMGELRFTLLTGCYVWKSGQGWDLQ